MFEDSLLESSHRLSTGNRWPAIASLALQATLAAVIVAVPLLHPEHLALALPSLTLAPPLAPPPPPPPPPVRVHVDAASSAPAEAAPAPAAAPAAAPRLNLHPVGIAPEGPPANLLGTGISMAFTTTPPFATGTADRPAVAVAATPTPSHMAISKGVAAGLLLAPIHPLYPQIARAAHIEGTVVVHAFISKTGAIESATVLSGPAMLYGSALDAVRAARYRPFRLNGEPVAVETTITINFRLGSGG